MLRISKLSFPGLGIGEFEVNSEAFTIFGVSIAWYALIITMGMVCAVAYTVFRAKKIGLLLDDVVDIAIFTIPIGIIGARLYYVLTKLEDYKSFADVINIRNGGLAIYGGIIAGALTVLTVCLIKKINFFAFADCCTPGIILAQAIGRWGNFMNGEAFGTEYSGFLRMGVKNHVSFGTFGVTEMVYVHPTFLYESLWNILGFVLINIFYKKKKYDGQVMLAVFAWYGFGRFFIEGLRTDSLWIGPFGLVTVIFGILLIAAICVFVYFLSDFKSAIISREFSRKQSILYLSVLGAASLSFIMIILDSFLFKSIAIIPQQRVSQVLGAIIFIICASIIAYLAIKRFEKPLYFKNNDKNSEKKA